MNPFTWFRNLCIKLYVWSWIKAEEARAAKQAKSDL